MAGGSTHGCPGPLDASLVPPVSDLHAESMGVGCALSVEPADTGHACDATEYAAAAKYDHCVSHEVACKVVIDPFLSNAIVVRRDNLRYAIAGVCLSCVISS